MTIIDFLLLIAGAAAGYVLGRDRAPYNVGPQIRARWTIQGIRHAGKWWPDDSVHRHIVETTVAEGNRIWGDGSHEIERRP